MHNRWTYYRRNTTYKLECQLFIVKSKNVVSDSKSQVLHRFNFITSDENDYYPQCCIDSLKCAKIKQIDFGSLREIIDQRERHYSLHPRIKAKGVSGFVIKVKLGKTISPDRIPIEMWKCK